MIPKESLHFGVRRHLGFNFVALLIIPSAVATTAPLVIAERYYDQDYAQAIKLLSDTLKLTRNRGDALLRLSELKLMVEGRASVRDLVLQFLESHQKNLSVDLRHKIQNKLSELQRIFLTDQGQSLYLQAVPRLQHDDFQSALSLLEQALQIEKGNTLIFLKKMLCEKKLGFVDRYYETLKRAFELDPFESDIVNELMEAHIYFSKPSDAVFLATHFLEEGVQPLRMRVAHAIALLDSGTFNRAEAILNSILEKEKNISVPPIVFFALGKIFKSKPNRSLEALAYLERFVKAVRVLEPMTVAQKSAWDPYRLHERVSESEQWIQQLKTTKTGFIKTVGRLKKAV